MSQSALDLANPQSFIPEKTKKKSFSDLIKSKVSGVLVGKNADDFVTNLVSLMNANTALKECDQESLVAAALQAQSLNLSLNKNLGQAWIVPFKDNSDRTRSRVLATFQIGYKGYVQLAIRSGYYRKINVLSIKEGELRSYDPLNEEIEADLIQDPLQRIQAESIGYYAMFEYLNGFRKTMYWPKEVMKAHAIQYSPAYKSDTLKKTAYSFWAKDFDGMAYKTMLRQLLSKWGIMSIEMQQAYDSDCRVIIDNETRGGFFDGDIIDSDNDSTPEIHHVTMPSLPQGDTKADKTNLKKHIHSPEKALLTNSVNTSTGEVLDNTDQSKGYLVICPNNNKEVDEIDCQSKPCRNGCIAFER